METKKIYKLTWITRKPSSYHKDTNGRSYKIYDRINHLRAAITDKQPSKYYIDNRGAKKLQEGVDYIVEICEVPVWEELWQSYELGEWETATEKWEKKRAKMKEGW